MLKKVLVRKQTQVLKIQFDITWKCIPNKFLDSTFNILRKAWLVASVNSRHGVNAQKSGAKIRAIYIHLHLFTYVYIVVVVFYTFASNTSMKGMQRLIKYLRLFLLNKRRFWYFHLMKIFDIRFWDMHTYLYTTYI